MEEESLYKDTILDKEVHNEAGWAEKEIYEEDDDQVNIDALEGVVRPHKKKAIVEKYFGDELLREAEISKWIQITFTSHYCNS
jgi:hypothetical protein